MVILSITPRLESDGLVHKSGHSGFTRKAVYPLPEEKSLVQIANIDLLFYSNTCVQLRKDLQKHITEMNKTGALLWLTVNQVKRLR
jgi:hypothetical protein